MSQVTAKKMIEIIRDIKNIARAKLPRTKCTRDGVEGIALTLSSSAQMSTDPLLDLNVPAGPREIGWPGFVEWPVGSAGDKTPVWMSTRIAEVETRSSGEIDGTSGLLQLSILEWGERLGEINGGKSSCQGKVNERGHVYIGSKM